MHVSATVLINAAGRGSRLGFGINKALMEFDGISLIEWQIMLLPRNVPVVVGIGFQAEAVKNKALRVREDIIFTYNPDFESTGTAATLVRSAQVTSGRIVSLDADLLVDPLDLSKFINSELDLVGVCVPSSVDPVLAETVKVEGHMNVSSFSRNNQSGLHQMEWTGLLNCLADDIKNSSEKGHVFELIQQRLPIRAISIKAKELDFAEELPGFALWLKQLKDRYI